MGGVRSPLFKTTIRGRPDEAPAHPVTLDPSVADSPDGPSAKRSATHLEALAQREVKRELANQVHSGPPTGL